MPYAMTNARDGFAPSMSDRAQMASAEISKLDAASLSQLQMRLTCWGGLLETLEADVPAPGGSRPSRDEEILHELKEMYRAACLRFDELQGGDAMALKSFTLGLESAWSCFEITLTRLTNQRS
jgi:hypothetical protein